MITNGRVSLISCSYKRFVITIYNGLFRKQLFRPKVSTKLLSSGEGRKAISDMSVQIYILLHPFPRFQLKLCIFTIPSSSFRKYKIERIRCIYRLAIFYIKQIPNVRGYSHFERNKFWDATLRRLLPLYSPLYLLIQSSRETPPLIFTLLLLSLSSSPCIYFSNDLTFPFSPHTACTFFLPPSTKISCSTLLFHIRTSLLVKYSGIVTVLIFLYSSLYLEHLILSYRFYLCNLFLPLSVSPLYGAMSFPLSSLCLLWSYRLSERIFLSSYHFNFLFFPFLISFVQPSSNFFSISLFLLHIYVLCSLPLFRFCSILWSFTMYVGVHLSSSNIHFTYLPLFYPSFSCSVHPHYSNARITDQYIIILVLKCLSDSFFPVANTFAIASLLDCSSSLQHNKYLYSFISFILSFILPPSLTSFPCLQSDFSLFSCNFFSFSQLSNFFSIVVLFNSFSVPTSSTTSSAYASTCTLTYPLSSLLSASLHDPVPSLLCTEQIARVLTGNPALFLPSSPVLILLLLCPVHFFYSFSQSRRDSISQHYSVQSRSVKSVECSLQ